MNFNKFLTKSLFLTLTLIVFTACEDFEVENLNAPDSERKPFDHTVEAMTAGAAPPAAVIEAMETQGFNVTHVYGLTETYGPSVVSAWKDEWNDSPIADRAALKARQGVRYHVLEALMVADPETLKPVPKTAVLWVRFSFEVMT